MISPKTFHPFERRVPGMNSIVHSAIHQVSEYKPGKEHKCLLTYNEVHQSKNGGSKNKTWNRWHKQPLPISWIVVMITMQRINEFFGPSAVGNHVKKKTMGQVFKKSPEEHTAQKSKSNSSGGKSNSTTVIHHVDHYRCVHSPNN